MAHSQKQRQNSFKKILEFIKETRSELRKVVWPSRRDTVIYTFVVIFTVAVVAGFIWVFDVIFSGGLRLILR